MPYREEFSVISEQLQAFEALASESSAKMLTAIDLFRDAREALPELYAGEGISAAAVMARAERAARAIADTIRDLRQTLGKVHRAGLEDAGGAGGGE